MKEPCVSSWIDSGTNTQHVRPVVVVPLDEAVHRIGRLIKKRIRPGNQQDIQCLLSTLLGRGAGLVRDGGMNAHAYVRGTFVDLIGAGLVDVDDFHRYGFCLDGVRQEGKDGDVGFRKYVEEINGGEIEELNGVNEEDADASCSFGSHC